MPTLSIIIPVFNEETTIVPLLDRVATVELPVRRQIIIVDDGSTDSTPARLAEWIAGHGDLDLIHHRQTNAGKGAAVRAGIQRSTGELLIIQDADLEYDPADYTACITPILQGRARVVYGSRERFRDNHRHSSWAFYAGGMLVSLWFSLLYQTWLTDEPTCYKTFDGELIRNLPFDGNGFDWEPEVTAKLLRLGHRIVEVPVRYAPRLMTEGKKIRWQDGVRALTVALHWRFRALPPEIRAQARQKR